jgi:ferredoxin
VSDQKVRVNPIACEAHGLCAELLPERIRLDDWGYPIVDPAPLPLGLRKNARRAVAACPTLALLIQKTTRACGVPASPPLAPSRVRSPPPP